MCNNNLVWFFRFKLRECGTRQDSVKLMECNVKNAKVHFNLIQYIIYYMVDGVHNSGWKLTTSKLQHNDATHEKKEKNEKWL